jgi:hypothetical protein
MTLFNTTRTMMFATLFGIFALSATAQAGIPAPNGAAGKHIGNALVAKELHVAKKLVGHGDHDYQGHRAKAEHLITEAIHELHPQHKKGSKTTGGAGAAGQGKGKGKGQKLKEPQVASDAQLKMALGILTKALGQVSHHPKAAAHIQGAIAELNMALKIK